MTLRYWSYTFVRYQNAGNSECCFLSRVLYKVIDYAESPVQTVTYFSCQSIALRYEGGYSGSHIFRKALSLENNSFCIRNFVLGNSIHTIKENRLLRNAKQFLIQRDERMKSFWNITDSKNENRFFFLYRTTFICCFETRLSFAEGMQALFFCNACVSIKLLEMLALGWFLYKVKQLTMSIICDRIQS